MGRKGGSIINDNVAVVLASLETTLTATASRQHHVFHKQPRSQAGLIPGLILSPRGHPSPPASSPHAPGDADPLQTRFAGVSRGHSHREGRHFCGNVGMRTWEREKKNAVDVLIEFHKYFTDDLDLCVDVNSTGRTLRARLTGWVCPLRIIRILFLEK